MDTEDEFCPACNGAARFDPQTGETRCSACWCRVDLLTIKGGQGRDAEPIGWSATIVGICLGLAAMVVVVAAIVAAVRS